MTVISFVGLFVLMYTDGIGYHIIFPHFTMVPAHPSIIAYRTTDRPSGSAGGTWQQMTDTITIDGVQYNYVQVSKQNIAILLVEQRGGDVAERKGWRSWKHRPRSSGS